jgi:hypothetical protein
VQLLGGAVGCLVASIAFGPLSVSAAVVASLPGAALGWVFASEATRSGWRSVIRAAFGLSLTVTCLATSVTTVAAGLLDGVVPGVLTGAFIEWAMFAWAWVGIPLAIAAFPLAIVWALTVHLAGRVLDIRNDTSG